MQHVLVTGGSGFFGGVLKRRLLRDGYSVTNIDLVPDREWHPHLVSLQGDIRNADWLLEIFQKNRFDAVFQCAAILAHGTHIDEPLLWSSNVDGTRNIAEAARAAGIPKLVFTSTNCLWAANRGHPITEEEEPCPIEIYGRSKLEGERVLSEYAAGMDVTILRCPTIIDSGRLGLLAILFEFIRENKTVWVVGNGNNTYQFIYAQDLEPVINFRGGSVVGKKEPRQGGGRGAWWFHVQGRQRSMGFFLPQPGGTGRIFAISSLLVTPVRSVQFAPPASISAKSCPSLPLLKLITGSSCSLPAGDALASLGDLSHRIGSGQTLTRSL